MCVNPLRFLFRPDSRDPSTLPFPKSLSCSLFLSAEEVRAATLSPPPPPAALAAEQQKLTVWHCERRRAVQKYLPKPPWPVLTFPFLAVLLLPPFLPRLCCQNPAFPLDLIYLLFETNTQVTQFEGPDPASAGVWKPSREWNGRDEITPTDQGCLFSKYAPNPLQTAEDRPAGSTPGAECPEKQKAHACVYLAKVCPESRSFPPSPETYRAEPKPLT